MGAWIWISWVGCLGGAPVPKDATTPTTTSQPCDDATGWWLDADLDGFGDPSEPRCEGGDGIVDNDDDCDDSNPAVRPGGVEACSVGAVRDDDCDPDTPEPIAMVDDTLHLDLVSAVASARPGVPVELCDGIWEVGTVPVDASVHITSASADPAAAVLKGTGGPIFEVRVANVELHLQDLTLDGGIGRVGGAVQAALLEDDTVTLHSSVVLQNVWAENNIAVRGGVVAAAEVYLDGSTLTDNHASADLDLGGGLGGAVYAQTANVVDSTLSSNSADLGGAILTLADVDSRQSVFSDNDAQLAGAVYALGETTSLDDQFETNSAGLGGAAVILRSSTFTDTWFTANMAEYGGALAVVGPSGASVPELVLQRCAFDGNTASMAGGAIRIEGSWNVSAPGATFVGNQAAGRSGAGGAVHLDFQAEPGEITWSEGTFTDNTAALEGGSFHLGCEGASSSVSLGGILVEDGIAELGGAVFVGRGCTAFLDDVQLDGNHATARGGGLYLSTGSRTFLGLSTLTSQTAVLGAAIFQIPGAQVALTECSMTGNVASDEDSGAIHLANGIDDPITEIDIQDSDLGSGTADNGPNDVVRGPDDPEATGYDWAQNRGANTTLFCNSASCIDL
ncbi:MAG: hypothetical protein KTR31_30810 [Myxococcales bacterium]|nr:hypothetical protein [Myxococcales bacterium]